MSIPAEDVLLNGELGCFGLWAMQTWQLCDICSMENDCIESRIWEDDDVNWKNINVGIIQEVETYLERLHNK